MGESGLNGPGDRHSGGTQRRYWHCQRPGINMEHLIGTDLVILGEAYIRQDIVAFPEIAQSPILEEVKRA